MTLSKNGQTPMDDVGFEPELEIKPMCHPETPPEYILKNFSMKVNTSESQVNWRVLNLISSIIYF